MHPCLHIAELRLAIFECFDPLDSVVGRPALLALATTCKALSDSSLDVLWKMQFDMRPLVCTMAQDLWTLVPCEVESLQEVFNFGPVVPLDVSFKRNLKESDWDRYHYYASKVQNLHLDTLGIELEAFAALCAYRPQQNLLPSLLTFHLNLRGYLHKSVDYIPALLGNTISYLGITFPSPNQPTFPGLEALLASIARVCNHVRTIGVQITSGDIHYQAALHSLLPKLTKLEHLFVAGVWRPSRDALEGLSSLQFIKSLKGPLVNNVTKDILKPLLAQSYPELTTLTLSVSEWKATAEVIEVLTTQSLRVLNLAPPPPLPSLLTGEPTPASLHISYNLLRSICSLASLTRLTLTDLEILDSDSNSTVNPQQLATSLLRLVNIQHLVLGIKSQPILDDTWLLEASNAFPDLRLFQLHWFTRASQEGPSQPKMTLEGLLPVLIKCRRLRTLGVHVVCKPFDWRKLYTMPQNWVNQVYLTCCPVEEPKRVIACLLFMFPNAKKIDGTSSISIEYFEHEYQSRRNWEEMHKFLSDYFKSKPSY